MGVPCRKWGESCSGCQLHCHHWMNFRVETKKVFREANFCSQCPWFYTDFIQNYNGALYMPAGSPLPMFLLWNFPRSTQRVFGWSREVNYWAILQYRVIFAGILDKWLLVHRICGETSSEGTLANSTSHVVAFVYTNAEPSVLNQVEISWQSEPSGTTDTTTSTPTITSTSTTTTTSTSTTISTTTTELPPGN